MLFHQAAGDQDRIEFSGIQPGYDCRGGIIEGSHVHPVGAEHDDVRLLTWGRRPDLCTEPGGFGALQSPID